MTAPCAQRSCRCDRCRAAGRCWCCADRTSALICSLARRTVAVDATIFGRMRLLADHARGKLIDGGLVEPGDGAQRPGNEMQLVLDDQIGRIERPAVVERPAFAPRLGGAVEADPFGEPVDVTEEGAGLADPGQARELVDGGDQESRQPPIDRLVDGQDRQRTIAREIAGGIGAADLQIGRRHVVRNAGKGCRLELGAAPRTSLERSGRALVLARSCTGARVRPPWFGRHRPCRPAGSAKRRTRPKGRSRSASRRACAGPFRRRSSDRCASARARTRRRPRARADRASAGAGVAHDDGDAGAEHARTGQAGDGR